MQNLVSLKIDPILVSSHILQYEKPDILYFLVQKEDNILLKKNEKVKIGQKIIENKENVICSSVSGVAKSITKIGDKSYLEIENDFTEKSILDSTKKRVSSKLTKEYIEERLDDKDLFIDKETLILNCLDDEPYVLNENFYLRMYCEEFLEFIDKVQKLYEIKNVIVCVKSNNGENIQRLISLIGTYPNIKLEICPNLYLLSRTTFLLKHLGIENKKNLVIKASLLFQIYNLIIRNRYSSTKLITISGDAVENPSIVNVKIGSKLKDVLKELIKINKEDVCYIKNGLMQGTKINMEEEIITNSFDSLLIMKKKEDRKEEDCIHCGACIHICPVKINPKLLKKENYKEKENCIKCGLCSYICPSYINFNTTLKEEER